jgi:hypothetical protein
MTGLRICTRVAYMREVLHKGSFAHRFIYITISVFGKQLLGMSLNSSNILNPHCLAATPYQAPPAQHPSY